MHDRMYVQAQWHARHVTGVTWLSRLVVLYAYLFCRGFSWALIGRRALHRVATACNAGRAEPLAYAAHLLRLSLASQQQHTWAGLPDWAKYSQLGYFLHLLAAKKLALATAGAHAAFWRHGFGLLYTYRWWRFVQKHLATLPISVIAPARVNKTFLHVVK